MQNPFVSQFRTALRRSGPVVSLLLLSLPGVAQTVTGSISGRVADPSGAVIAGATAVLTNEGTRETAESQTQDDGSFQFLAVRPGKYTVSVTKDGFRRFEQKGNTLTANERLGLGDLVLTFGAVTEQVTVTANGAVVETTNANRSALITQNQIESIANRGRDVMSYLRLLPGVSYSASVDPESVGGNFGTSTPNIQGMRNTWNTVALDGMTSNNAAAQGVSSATVNLDAIGEVKVLMNNFNAEYGRNGAAMVNVITKSGTQDFHGSGYWYKRHEMFNANNFFNNANNRPRPLYRYNTYGATLGGPMLIPKINTRANPKLFFFYSFEYSQVKEPRALQQHTLPTAAERAGDFSNSLDQGNRLIVVNDPTTGAPFPGNRVPANRINALGQGILNLFPLPNTTDRAITRGAYNNVFQESVDVPKTQHLFRVDYRLSSKDSIYVRGLTWAADTRGYGVPAGVQGSSLWGLVRQHYDFTDNGITVNHTRIFSSRIVNELSAGIRRTVEVGPPVSDEELKKVVRTERGLGGLKQFYPQFNPLNVIPEATFADIPSGGGIQFDGLGRWPIDGRDTTFNASEALSIILGKHTVKAGAFLERVHNYEGPAGRFSGQFAFGRDVNNPLDSNYGYSNALLGNFQSYLESTTRPAPSARVLNVQWYVQDSWQVTRRLTLDFGMRFVRTTPWQFDNGAAGAFAMERYQINRAPQLYRPINTANGARAVHPTTGEIVPAVLIGAIAPGTGDPVNGSISGTDSSYPSGFIDQYPVLVQPRAGFAWDVFGDGKTAVRGGVGIFHQSIQTDTLTPNLPRNPPQQYNPTIFYGNMDTFLQSAGTLFPSDTRGVNRAAKVPTSYNFLFSIQRQLFRDTLLDVAYSGNMGRHLEWVRNLNVVPYGARFQSSNLDPTNPTRPLNDNFFRPYPGYGNVLYHDFAGTSNYNSLQASLNRRFTAGLQFGVAYTWSKAMGYGAADNTTVATYQAVRVWNYGKLSFDQTHNLVINYNWDVPRASKLVNHAIVRGVLDNWQITGFTTFASGQPRGVGFTTVDGADITGGGDGARIVVTGKAPLGHGDRTFDRWFDTSVFARPARGTAGNAPIDVFRGPGLNNWDISFFKKIPLRSDRRFLQMRWEMYNAFNHTQYDGVDNTARFDAAGQQVNTRFGQVISARAERRMQASLRLTF